MLVGIAIGKCAYSLEIRVLDIERKYCQMFVARKNTRGSARGLVSLPDFKSGVGC